MVLQSCIFVLTVAFWFQGNVPPSTVAIADCLTAVEKQRLSKERNIEGRIKIYREVSVRLYKAVEGAVAKTNFDVVPDLLGCWKDHLTGSLKDIEANINRKKKSGALIDYEIQVRKSITDINDARLKAPVQQQSDFQSWLAQASMVHQKFVDILFQR